MIKKICSICEKKLNDSKKDKVWEIPVHYHIEITQVGSDGSGNLSSDEILLCPACFAKTKLQNPMEKEK